MKKGTEIYFSSYEDEVVKFDVKRKNINSSYNYQSKNIFYKVVSFVVYRLILTPAFWLYFKLFNRVKIKNRKVLKSVKSGYYIYSNHTNKICDVACPTFICAPKKPHIIVNADNVSIPLLGSIVKMCGALPLPDDFQSSKNFYQAIKNLNRKKKPIFIYPEAHLWPYYTKIRKFPCSSFHYPVETNSPIFTSTTTYHKRKFSKKPRVEIYIDGPFYPDLTLKKAERKEKLCEIAFNQMNERANLNSYEFVNYIKRSTND